MKDKSKLIAIVLVILTIVVVVISTIFNKDSEIEKNDVNIVTNYSNFYTINSCLYRVITYLSEKDNESLFLLVDENYKKENDITKDNVLSIFDEVQENNTFESKKMYYEELSDNITKYYVYGVAFENQIYDGQELLESTYQDLYFIVYLDSENKTFSIEPYDGKIFIEGDTNE